MNMLLSISKNWISLQKNISDKFYLHNTVFYNISDCTLLFVSVCEV